VNDEWEWDDVNGDVYVTVFKHWFSNPPAAKAMGVVIKSN